MKEKYYTALRGFQNPTFGNVTEGQQFEKNKQSDHMHDLGYLGKTKKDAKSKVLKNTSKNKIYSSDSKNTKGNNV